MASVKYEVIAKAGTYKSAQGEEKTKWHKCGVVIDNGKGLSLKLESLPIGFDGWLNLWEPKPKEEAAKPDPARHFDDMRDEIPFR